VAMLQQNPLLLVGLLIVIVVLLFAATRSRKKQTPASTAPTAGMTYCSKCGTQNPPTNEFCGKCGNKLH
jgi:ribosomal protein L40E